jgi:hypothetical protein
MRFKTLCQKSKQGKPERMGKIHGQTLIHSKTNMTLIQASATDHLKVEEDQSSIM